MTKVVAITGKKGSGKDTSARFFIEAGYVQLRFADTLKEMLAVLFRHWGYDEEMILRLIDGDLKEVPCAALAGKTPRYAMQKLGTEWRDMIDTKLWTNIFHRRAPHHEKVIVTDCRFPHEQEELRHYDSTLIRLHGGPGRTAEGEEHPSETLVDTLVPDVVIMNHGTLQELEENVKQVMRTLE